MLERVVLQERSLFLGADSLFDGINNTTFFINRDKTGFYVFFMNDGNPAVRWVRGVRNMDPLKFKALRKHMLKSIGVGGGHIVTCVNVH